MHEDKVAEIYDYLIRRIPDVRVTGTSSIICWTRPSITCD
jgi:hypothetical protein